MKIIFKKTSFLFFVMDLLWVFFFIMEAGRGGDWPIASILDARFEEVLWFMGIWCFFSFLFRKFASISASFLSGIRNLLLANVCSFVGIALLSTTTSLSFLSVQDFIKFGVDLTIGEGCLFFLFLNVNAWFSQGTFPDSTAIYEYLNRSEETLIFPIHEKQDQEAKVFQKYKSMLQSQFGLEAFNYLSRHFNFSNPRQRFCNASSLDEVVGGSQHSYERIFSGLLVNDFRRINKFFEAVNTKLVPGGIFICVLHPQDVLVRKIFEKWPPVINTLIFFGYFLFKRIFPKLKGTRGLYFYLTRGRKRSLSEVETLGRLYSCGFEFVEQYSAGEFTFFVVRKVKDPVYDMTPSYGPVFKMRRVGIGGKVICIYKFRTMYPYSEYLQEYLYERNQLRNGGKIQNDIRITPMGRVLRRFWLDELPNLVNFLKGDLKLFGVRPLSRHYLSLYAADLQELRKKVKPGLIPPFYADLPNSLEEIQESEKRYIESYLKHPWSTDLHYLGAALKNIFLKRALSH